MDKILFEDGKLVTAGYVEIDGVKYEVKPAKYEGKTPLIALNLNKMQDNIEKEINSKSENASTIENISIEGESKQKIREGYNILPGTKLRTQAKNGVDFKINDDKSAILNGKSTSYTDIPLDGEWGENKPIVLTLTAGKTYKVRIGKDTNIQGYEGTTAKSTFYDNQTITPSSDINYTFLALAIDTGKTFNNTLVEPMIYEYDGSDKPYEQYGATPSTEFESPVESCGDNINHFNIDTVTNQMINATTGAIIANNDWRLSDYIPAFPLVDYILHWESDNGFFQAVIAMFDKDKNLLSGYTYGIGNTYKKSFKTVENCKYIRVSYSVNVSGKEVNRENIKLERGKVATPYSPYGQGSIAVVNSNENLAKINEENWEVLKNKIKNKGRNSGVELTRTKLKANKKYNVFLKTIKNPTTVTTFSPYINEVEQNGKVYGFIDITQWKSGTVIKRTIVPTEDIELKYIMWGNANSEIMEFQLWITEETETDYIEHKGSTHIIPTQKPMRSLEDTRDSFVKIDGQWYEKHSIGLYMFSGNESWFQSTTWSNKNAFVSDQIDWKPKLVEGVHTKANLMCSHFKVYTPDEVSKLNGSGISQGSKDNIFLSVPGVTTTTDIKVWLPENNVRLYYELATPELIPCTAEQTKVLNDIYSDYADGATNMYSTDDIEPVIEIVKESKEQVQSETNRAISALIERVSQLEARLASTQAEEGT